MKAGGSPPGNDTKGSYHETVSSRPACRCCYLGAGVGAQQMVSKKVVQPELITEDKKVKITRILLKPGEGTPLHTHSLDNIAVIMQGSTMKDVETDGKFKNVDQKSGDVHYVPGTGRTHSFANTGTSPLEIVPIELK